MRKVNLTLTDVYNYTERVFLEEGWISPQKAREIRRDSLLLAIAIVSIPLILSILFILK